MTYQDYYQILGVPRHADEKAIKSAFRRLARRYHPDTNRGDPKAEERFKAINEAYTVLSDPDKRQKYDRLGKDWERFERSGGNPRDFNWNQWGTGDQQQRMTREAFEQMMRGQGMGSQGFSSFFEQLFGRGDMGTMGGFQSSPPPSHAPPQRTVETELTLEEAYRGTSRTVRMSNGQKIKADVPPGVKTGSRIRLRGSGHEREGDIYLRVTVKPHAAFTVKGEDLEMEVPIDLYTAVLGGEVPVPTLDGTVYLTISPGTQNNTRVSLSGKGMPHLKQPDRKGKLIAVIRVEIPMNLSSRDRALFEELRHNQA